MSTIPEIMKREGCGYREARAIQDGHGCSLAPVAGSAIRCPTSSEAGDRAVEEAVLAALRKSPPGSAPYDPLETLRAEVVRFKATNRFTPMEVTGFYLQAACVVTELENARNELRDLRMRSESQARKIRDLERKLYALDE